MHPDGQMPRCTYCVNIKFSIKQLKLFYKYYTYYNKILLKKKQL